jgi:hypothetical protein
VIGSLSGEDAQAQHQQNWGGGMPAQNGNFKKKGKRGAMGKAGGGHGQGRGNANKSIRRCAEQGDVGYVSLSCARRRTPFQLLPAALHPTTANLLSIPLRAAAERCSICARCTRAGTISWTNWPRRCSCRYESLTPPAHAGAGHANSIVRPPHTHARAHLPTYTHTRRHCD